MGLKKRVKRSFLGHEFNQIRGNRKNVIGGENNERKGLIVI